MAEILEFLKKERVMMMKTVYLNVIMIMGMKMIFIWMNPTLILCLVLETMLFAIGALVLCKVGPEKWKILPFLIFFSYQVVIKACSLVSSMVTVE